MKNKKYSIEIVYKKNPKHIVLKSFSSYFGLYLFMCGLQFDYNRIKSIDFV